MQRTIWQIGFAALTLVLLGAWSLSVHWDRVITLQLAQERLAATAKVLGHHAERAFEAGDGVAIAIAELAASADLSDPEERLRLHHRLRLLVDGSAQIVSAWVLDVTGDTVADPWGQPSGTRSNFAYRDYFRTHAAGEHHVFIGPSGVGTMTGVQRFTLSRGIRRQDGSFAGVAVTGVSSDYFSNVYRQADIGADATVRLTARSGGLLAQWPGRASAGAAAARSEADEADVLTAVESVPGYPVAIEVTRPVASVLSDWRERTLRTGAAALAVIAAFGALTALGLRASRGEQAARAALERWNRTLESRVAGRTALQAATKEALERAIGGAPLPEVLDILVRIGAFHLRGGTAIFLMDERPGGLRPASAAGIGEAFVKAVERLPIAPTARCCKSAAFGGERVVVRDVEEDPLWEPFRPLTRKQGIRACWSTSIRSFDGRVLGIFVVCHDTPREPGPHDLDTTDLLVHTALTVIERDVAEAARRIAEAAVRESEQRFRALVQSTSDVVYRMNRDWSEMRILSGGRYVADAAEAKRGWLEDFILPDDRERVRAAVDEVVHIGGKYELEHRIRRRDGTLGWIIARAVPLLDGQGGIVEWFGAASDITARKRAEAALAEREERLRLVLDSLKDYAIMTLDRGGRVTSWNSGAEHLLGYSEAEVLGRHDRMFFTPDDMAGGLAEAEMATADRVGTAENERWHVRKDGSRFWASGLTVPLAAGSPLGYVKMFRDLTVRKKAEDHAQLLVNELNHRVKNTLATVQAIATLALKGSSVEEPVREALESRLLALARSHDLLTRESWEGADLRDVVVQAVQPFRTRGGEGRFQIDGPDFRLRPQIALSLGMAFHELATNAVKYGALSVTGGIVRVAWRVEPAAEGDRLCVVWRERGGPPVTPPTRKGFGTRLMERALARELEGEVALTFDPDGLHCTIIMPSVNAEGPR